MADELLFDVSDGVARLTLNRPERRNALTWTMIAALRERVAECRARDDVRVIVLQGAGDDAFCAGADLGGMAGDTSVAAMHSARGELAGLFTDLYGAGKPTVAKVRGFCLAGGFGLALACDLLVAADDATFGTPEIKVGLWPYMITVPLCRTLPPKKALELMMTGRRIDAAEADRLGVTTRVVGTDRLDDEVGELCATLAASSPLVMRVGRNSFYDVWDLGAEASLAVLHPLLSLNASFDDAAEGIAAFMEKRPAEWSGT